MGNEAKRKNNYETITVKRINNNNAHKENIQVFKYCDCCGKPADINIELTNKKAKNKGEKKPSKAYKNIYLCQPHVEKIKEILDYF